MYQMHYSRFRGNQNERSNFHFKLISMGILLLELLCGDEFGEVTRPSSGFLSIIILGAHSHSTNADKQRNSGW